jgi:amidase
VIRTELAFVPALEQAELVRTRQVSPVELVDLYLERADRLNPIVNCYITIAHEQARAWAAAAESAVLRGDPLGPFHGVPISIKDMTDTAGIRSTWGSAGFRERVPAEDAHVVKRLKQAGFVVLGKTNMPEFASGPTDPIGYGACRNPWNLERTVLGSSGGAGASVAAGLAAIAQGTDAGGSVRLPAAACGLVGFKPSRGRVSNHPLGANPLLTDGPLARTVADAAAMLDAIQGYVTGDAFWAPPPARPFLEESKAPPDRLRVAFLTTAAGAEVDPEFQRAVRDTAAELERLGHEVTEAGPDWSDHDLRDAMIQSFGALLVSLEDDLPPEETWDPIMRELIPGTRALSLADYVKRQQRAAARSREIVAFWNDHDALLIPSLAGKVNRIDELRRPDGGSSRTLRVGPFNYVWNVTGQPAIVLPAGLDSEGLPLSVQVVGRPADDATVFRLAAQLEQARPWAHLRPPDL